MSRTLATCGVLIAFAAVGPRLAAAQSRANVQVALERTVELKTVDSIGAVFQRLSEMTGVKFVLGADVYACLPYAEDTRLDVHIARYTLREALTRMLAPVAMEWIIEGDSARISPSPALLRMNRRATREELVVLGKIHSEKLQPAAQGGDVLDQLRALTGDKDLDLRFHVQADRQAAIQRAERVLPATGAVWLDMLCHGQGWTWYLWGDAVMIVDQKTQIERQLQRQISLRCEGAQLVAVLLDLARQARVKLNMDPGVMDLVPIETQRNFNLVMSDATVAQALEVISGATGLVFVRDNDGLRVEASDRLKERTGGSEADRKRSSFFIKKTITLPDGSSIDLILRAEELPPDVQEAIKAEREKLFEQLIRKYGSTTRPATQPAP